MQPAYAEPFRVTSKVSDVVIKVRNIRTGVSKTLHTDRIRIIHEDNITPHQNQNVRKNIQCMRTVKQVRPREITVIRSISFYNDDNSDSEEIDSTAKDN